MPVELTESAKRKARKMKARKATKAGKRKATDTSKSTAIGRKNRRAGAALAAARRFTNQTTDSNN